MSKLAKNSLYSKVASIIELARLRASTAINLSMVYAYYEIGKHIVEDEQQGKQRAEYGKQIRQFYLVYSKGQAVSDQLTTRKFALYLPDKKLLQNKLKEWVDLSSPLPRRQQ